MNAEATTRQQYLNALDDFWTARPLVGHHTIGTLDIMVSARSWSVSDGKHFRSSGNNRTPDGLRTGISMAVRLFVKLHIIH